MRRNSNTKTEKSGKKGLKTLLKVLIALGLLALIFTSSLLFEDYYDKMRWHTTPEKLNSMDYYFLEKDYVRLYEMTQRNVALKMDMDDLSLEYVAFANCYDAAVDYHMYEETGHTDRAQESLERFEENYKALSRTQLLEALPEIVEAYALPETVLE